MLQNILTAFLNENVLFSLIIALFITAVLMKTFPIFSGIDVKRQTFYLNEFIIQFIIGICLVICLTLVNVITPPLIFYNKNLFLKDGCHELPGCMVKDGMFYIPNVNIQYSNDPDFYKITCKYKNIKTNKIQENQIFLNQKYIFGWE